MKKFRLGKIPPQTLAIWAMAVGLIFVLLSLPGAPPSQRHAISYTEMIQYIKELPSEKDGSATLVVRGEKWELRQEKDDRVLTTAGPITEGFLELAQNQHPGLRLVIKPAEQPSVFWSLLAGILPFLLLGFLFWFFLRGMMKNQGKKQACTSSPSQALTS